MRRDWDRETELARRAQAQLVMTSLKRNTGSVGLSSDQKRLMEYFWNRYFSDRRDGVPKAVIQFLEVTRLSPDPTSPGARLLLDQWLDDLCHLKYLRQEQEGNEIMYRLDERGIEYLAITTASFLRTPHRFAVRYLKLWQLLGVIVGMAFAAATFLARLQGLF